MAMAMPPARLVFSLAAAFSTLPTPLLVLVPFVRIGPWTPRGSVSIVEFI
jgi:hypothetical protein